MSSAQTYYFAARHSLLWDDRDESGGNVIFVIIIKWN